MLSFWFSVERNDYLRNLRKFSEKVSEIFRRRSKIFCQTFDNLIKCKKLPKRKKNQMILQPCKEEFGTLGRCNPISCRMLSFCIPKPDKGLRFSRNKMVFLMLVWVIDHQDLVCSFKTLFSWWFNKIFNGNSLPPKIRKTFSNLKKKF